LHDLDRGIQSYQISEPERARFGSSDGRTSQFIHLVKVETQFPGQFKYLSHRCHPDPITYESRSILTPDGFFSQIGVTKLHEKINDVRVCVFGRDDFKQLHVSRRIEKVSPEEVFFKIFGSTLRHHMDWDARCVGSHQGS